MVFKVLPFLECRTKYFRSKKAPSWMDLAIAVWRALQFAGISMDGGCPEDKNWSDAARWIGNRQTGDPTLGGGIVSPSWLRVFHSSERAPVTCLISPPKCPSAISQTFVHVAFSAVSFCNANTSRVTHAALISSYLRLLINSNHYTRPLNLPRRELTECFFDNIATR